MGKTLFRLFVVTVALLLLMTAGGKVAAALGHSRALEAADPIFGLPFRWLLLIAAAGEAGTAGACLFFRDRRLKVGLLLWLAGTFVAYRIDLAVVGYSGPCHCMGTLTDSLGISPGAAEEVVKAILAFLIIGSLLSAVWLWWEGWDQACGCGPLALGRPQTGDKLVENHDSDQGCQHGRLSS